MGSDLFAQQVAAWSPNLFRFAFSLCHDRTLAEDLAQDTILKALTHRKQFKQGTNLGAWLFTICKHRYLSVVRFGDREVGDDVLVEMAADQPLTNAPSGELDYLLRSADAKKRLVLVPLAQGFDFHDIALRLRIPETTVRTKIFRARQWAYEVLQRKPYKRIKRKPRRYCRRVLGGESTNLRMEFS